MEKIGICVFHPWNDSTCLMGVMEHIITEGEEEAYQSEIQYQNVQSEFK